MVVQEREAVTVLVVPECRDDQTWRLGPLGARRPADLRDFVLQPPQRRFDRALVRRLDDPPHRLVPQRPQHHQGRLRPEGEVEAEQGDGLLPLDVFNRLSQDRSSPCFLRAVALGQALALDPVGVRVPENAVQQLQLPLGYH